MNLDIQKQNPLAMYKLLTNLVVPRPIAWVTSKDAKGRLNLAPFSFFNLVGANPPVLVIGVGNEADGRPKHTGRNIAATKEFVVNLVTEDLVQPMNLTAADFPEGHNELEAAGLHEAESLMVSVPRVAEAQAALECVLYKLERVGENNLVIGQVVGLYTADGIVDQRLHVNGFHPIGRMGSPSTYTRTADRFEVPRVSYAEVRASSRH